MKYILLLALAFCLPYAKANDNMDIGLITLSGDEIFRTMPSNTTARELIRALHQDPAFSNSGGTLQLLLEGKLITYADYDLPISEIFRYANLSPETDKFTIVSLTAQPLKDYTWQNVFNRYALIFSADELRIIKHKSYDLAEIPADLAQPIGGMISLRFLDIISSLFVKGVYNFADCALFLKMFLEDFDVSTITQPEAQNYSQKIMENITVLIAKTDNLPAFKKLLNKIDNEFDAEAAQGNARYRANLLLQENPVSFFWEHNAKDCGAYAIKRFSNPDTHNSNGFAFVHLTNCQAVPLVDNDFFEKILQTMEADNTLTTESVKILMRGVTKIAYTSLKAVTLILENYQGLVEKYGSGIDDFDPINTILLNTLEKVTTKSICNIIFRNPKFQFNELTKRYINTFLSEDCRYCVDILHILADAKFERSTSNSPLNLEIAPLIINLQKKNSFSKADYDKKLNLILQNPEVRRELNLERNNHIIDDILSNFIEYLTTESISFCERVKQRNFQSRLHGMV